MKEADYFISGVWKNDEGVITHVMLHTVNEGNRFGMGIKTSEQEAIGLIEARKKIKTITWGYPEWNLGAEIIVVHLYGSTYLRTVANATPKDNLDNSLLMNVIK